jgi:nucleoside 2-deoxyribosyltransferase
VRRPSISVDEKLVFVVISFDASMDPAFEAICAAAKACGLVAKRVKDVLGDYRITDKMLAMIASARFIVADLSLERPNVYFELGYARGLGKRVITILRDGSSAHFDVQDWQYLAYADSRPLEKDLADRFRYELQRRDEDD